MHAHCQLCRAIKHKTQGLKVGFEVDFGSPDHMFDKDFRPVVQKVSPLALGRGIRRKGSAMTCMPFLQFWSNEADAGSLGGPAAIARQVGLRSCLPCQGNGMQLDRLI